MQRRMVDLQEQRIVRSISDGVGALSVMIGTSVPLSSSKRNSSAGQRSDRRARHVTTCRYPEATVVAYPTCWRHALKWNVLGWCELTLTKLIQTSLQLRIVYLGVDK